MMLSNSCKSTKMTIILKLISITLTCFISVSCEGCFKTCVYDMIDLKNKMNEIKTCADDINGLKEKLEVQENKTRELEYQLEHERNKAKGISFFTNYIMSIIQSSLKVELRVF